MKIQTPFGPAWASIDQNGAVTAFGFGESAQASGLSLELEKQVGEYFAGTRLQFSVPLAPKGTEFQKRVWAALQEIPFGTRLTYTEVARMLGVPKAPRAIGRANATNPIALLIPCHRLVGATGDLTGYAYGIEIKRNLLDWERQVRGAFLDGSESLQCVS